MYAGLDGCTSGWVAVVIDRAGFRSAHVFPDFATAMVALGSADAIGVDMPVGLMDTGDREADRAARAYLKGQASSVFSAPARPVLEAVTYTEALEISQRVQGKGLSKQSFAIMPKMREVDAFVEEERLHEVHPEVSFRLMNGGERLGKKKSWGGLAARRRLLREAGVELPEDLGEANDVGIDDVVDAAIAAWSARRIAKGEARSFPHQLSQSDVSGRLIAIWA